jgi:putative acetyltransferase
MPLPDKFTIRPAANKDSSEIKDLIFGILEEYDLSSDPENTDSDLENIEQHYLNNRGIFDVILNPDGEIIASTGICRINQKTCELRKMYLRKSYRGMGLGKFLLDHSIEEAKRLGYRKIILETASVLKEAINLYERYGFRQYKPEHISRRCDKTYYLIIESEEE